MLQRAALRLLGESELVELAERGRGDASEGPRHTLIDAIAAELHERRTEVARDALLALDGTARPRVRALQIDAAASRGDWERVERALLDPHHGPRAVATRWLVRTRRIDGLAQLADPDPAVREAALSAATA